MYRLLALVVALLANVAHAAPPNERCVVLVSVDGLAGFYLDDPRAELPTLRRLAREGARADGLICSFPTVTWPNHTTLVTGVPPARHGVVGNNYIDRATGKPVALIVDPIFDKTEIVRTATVYDLAHAAGLKTAGIVWPATRNAPTLDFCVPDMPDDAWMKYGTRAWLSELREAGIPVDRHGEWVRAATGGVQRDWLYTRMAAQVLEKHSPNVLLVHLIETDHVQHRYGPRTDEAYWAVSYADDRLRDMVEAIERSPLGKNTTLFVCSDHGFFPIEKDIRPNVQLKQMGLVEVDAAGKVANPQAICLAQGGGCAVYVLNDARRAEIVEQLTTTLAALEGVAEVIPAAQFDRIGQPTRDQDPKGADLWLSARSGFAFNDSAAGDNAVVPRDGKGGTHGYLPEQPDLLGTCVVWGAGVEAGTSLGTVSNQDIAPTMARLLDLTIPDASGKPLPGIGH